MQSRRRRERAVEDEPFALTPHLPNYVLVADHNFSPLDLDAFPEVYTDSPTLAEGMKQTEVQFQFSVKFPLARSLVGDRGEIWAAYTNRSFWQFYAWEVSAPFRETDHTPELWFQLDTDRRLAGLHLAFARLGVVHQSNGQAGELSRSWNRVYATVVVDRPGLALALQPWIILPGLEDNPDIHDYMGNLEVRLVAKPGRHTLAATAHGNLDPTDPHGGLQLDWSFPLYGTYRGYVQGYRGTGKSLLDYDVRLTSLGFGVELTDYL